MTTRNIERLEDLPGFMSPATIDTINAAPALIESANTLAAQAQTPAAPAAPASAPASGPDFGAGTTRTCSPKSTPDPRLGDIPAIA